MSTFDNELYTLRKAYWTEKFDEMWKSIKEDSIEDDDAFWNAGEDYFN